MECRAEAEHRVERAQGTSQRSRVVAAVWRGRKPDPQVESAVSGAWQNAFRHGNAATPDKALQAENEQLKKVLGEKVLEVEILKKLSSL